jgi:uncharacterized repeat protein (TIGR03803 family)
MKKILLVLLVLGASLLTVKAQHYMLYGMTNGNGGTIFSYDLNSNQVYSVFYLNNSTGDYPEGNLVYDPNDSLLYGLTNAGGTGKGDGVIFSYNPLTGQDSVRMLFNYNNGEYPYYGGMTFYNNKFYGMTNSGGSGDEGVIFRFDPTNNTDTLLDIFTGNLQGPQGVYLAPYSNGLLYGMTYGGGSSGAGTLFSYDQALGKDSLLVPLRASLGDEPYEGGLTLYPVDSTLYSLIAYGGANSDGTINRFDPHTGLDTAIFSFNGANGQTPYGSLLYNPADSTFYGMTIGGGPNANGVIFSYKPSTAKDSVLFSFNGNNGGSPYGDLILGPGNVLYGMTYGGGGYLYFNGEGWSSRPGGVLFKYDLNTGIYTVLYNLDPNATGVDPYGSLTLVDVTPKITITNVVNEPCHGYDSGSITAMGQGGFKPYTYTWSAGNMTGATATGLLAGTYTVTMKDASGYSVTASATVTQPAQLAASVGSSNSVSCYGGSNGSATINATGGTPPYNYSWTPSGGVNSASYNLAANSYNVLVTDANRCFISTNVVITQPASAISVTLNVTAGNRNQSAIKAVVTGGTPPYTYSWTPAYSLSDSIGHLSSGIYSVTVTDSNGCSQNASVDIRVVAGVNNLGTDNNDIKVYPNPSNDIVNIEFSKPVDGLLTLCNVLGEQVYVGTIANTNTVKQIDISSLSKGVYLLKIESGGQSTVKRIVKL